MVLNQQRSIHVFLPTLRRFLARVQRTLHLRKDSVTVCLVNNAEMARLNRRYRGKRGATDVLSFLVNGGTEKSPPGPARRKRSGPALRRGQTRLFPSYHGDIVIAPAVARQNARRWRRTMPDELRILILHGVLHLLGYDHETDDGEMERYEARLRRRLGLA